MTTEPDELGPYRLGAPVRHRGLFVVYEATHRELGRSAWVVTTAPSLSGRDDVAKRLEERAALVSRFGGLSALAVYEVVRAGGRSGVVLERPTGPSLEDLKRELAPTGGLTPLEVVAVGALVSRAVATIHAEGAVHLALSPADIYFTKSGSVRLGGLLDAVPVGTVVDEKDIPEPGLEASYRAPERIAGDPPRPQSDVFSIGVILHELASGSHPFSAEGPTGFARRVRTAPPPPLPARAVDGLEHVLGRALEKPPALRHESAARLADDLEGLLEPPTSPEQVARAALARAGFDVDGVVSTGPRPLELRPLALQLAAVLTIMILGAAVVGGASGPPEPLGLRAGERAGYVRVLAHPWAEVAIDGEVVDTTPIGKPIPVAPGKHEILLRHPKAPDERRSIEIAVGETAVIDVEMAVERKIQQPVDTSP